MEEQILLALVAALMGLVMYRRQTTVDIVKHDSTPVKSLELKDKLSTKEPKKTEEIVPEKLEPIIEEYFSDSE